MMQAFQCGMLGPKGKRTEFLHVWNSKYKNRKVQIGNIRLRVPFLNYQGQMTARLDVGGHFRKACSKYRVVDVTRQPTRNFQICNLSLISTTKIATRPNSKPYMSVSQQLRSCGCWNCASKDQALPCTAKARKIEDLR
jgi:hypothetical protein